jgi:hypothetical protein
MTNKQSTTRAAIECNSLTEVTTKVRVSKRSDMDTGAVPDGMHDGPTVIALEMAMELGTAVTPIAAVTTCTVKPEHME